MAFDQTDPRAALASAAAAAEPDHGAAAAECFTLKTYTPTVASPGHKTWVVRGQHLVVAYTEASAHTVLPGTDLDHEHMVLLPDVGAMIAQGGTRVEVAAQSLVVIPPGPHTLELIDAGRVVQLYLPEAADLAACAVNAGTYDRPNPAVAAYASWPGARSGDRLRPYTLDVAPDDERFGRIFRCSTLMVNVLEPLDGPRDTSRLSPHSHVGFEQCSIALEGRYIHHLRWPWTVNLDDWRPDQHIACESPSVLIIPPGVIHTSQAVGEGRHELVDVFSPPRTDFSDQAGWVLNADDYPRAPSA